MFGHNVFSYGAIPTSYNGESVVFNSTEYDIPNTTSNNNFSVLVKWVESTESYHFKGIPMAQYEDTGEKFARKVQNSTIGDYGGVKARLDAGQGLIFESLSPADMGEDDDGGSNGDSNGKPIKGCMDDTATNYDESATEDDGTCEFEEDKIDPNLITYGIMGIVGIIAISILKK
jgi:hypothetical protein